MKGTLIDGHGKNEMELIVARLTGTIGADDLVNVEAVFGDTFQNRDVLKESGFWALGKIRVNFSPAFVFVRKDKWPAAKRLVEKADRASYGGKADITMCVAENDGV